jgi:hypothetical protein
LRLYIFITFVTAFTILFLTSGDSQYAIEDQPRIGTPGGGTHTPPGAAAMAVAMDIPATQLVSATLGTSDAQGTDAFTSALVGFPTQGSSYAVISSGHAPDTFLPNNSGSLSRVLGGLNNSQGNDLVQLTLILNVPPGASHWAVDWKFFSEEFPEFVGTQFNDAFLIETAPFPPFSNFVISGVSTITAPNNVAFDPSGELVTINTTGAVGMTAANATGTTYDGATATLTSVAAIPTGAPTITIVFSVMDLGDSIFDTTVFLDNFRFVFPTVPPTALDKMIHIPVRWCAIAGAPSQVNPGLVGEASIKDVLWRRHERVTDNIYQPQARIGLRSGATSSLPSFPVITDLNMSAGSQPGDVLDPRFDGGVEWRATINRCREVWRASAPTVTGLTAVHMRRFVDNAGNPTTLGGLGGLSVVSNSPSQLARGDAMVIDSAFGLSGSPIRIYGPDDVDKLLGHELGHGLSLWHGNGVDDDGNGIIDGPPHLTEPGETTNGPNLMQYQFSPPGITVTAGQAARMRSQALLHIPDRETDPEPLPLGNTGVDILGDVAIGMEFADINEFGTAVDPDAGVTYFFTNFNGLLPDDLTGLAVFFLIDTDNNPATGGDPSSIPGTPSATGIDLVIKAEVNLSGGLATAGVEVFKFNTAASQFETVVDPNISAEVTRELLALIDISDPSMVEDPIEVSNGVQVTIPSMLIDQLGMEIGLEMQTMMGMEEIDGAQTNLTFDIETFPSCQVIPQVAAPGDTTVIEAIDLPPNSLVHAFLGADEVASGATDSAGNVALAFAIPLDTTLGDRLVTVGIDDPDNAITADCGVIVTNPPLFDVPPTPEGGTEFTINVGGTVAFPVQALDLDTEDEVTLNIIELPPGATFTPTSDNPAVGTFSWTPGAGQEGVHTLIFTATDNNGLSAQPHSIVIQVEAVIPVFIDFEDAPSELNGIFKGINWGQEKWLIDDLPCGACPPRLAFFNSAIGQCRDFTFVNPSILKSFNSSAHTPATEGLVEVRSFDAAGNVVETFGPAFVTNGACTLFETGWTRLSTRVEICFTHGWELAFDNVTYQTLAAP